MEKLLESYPSENNCNKCPRRKRFDHFRDRRGQKKNRQMPTIYLYILVKIKQCKNLKQITFLYAQYSSNFAQNILQAYLWKSKDYAQRLTIIIIIFFLTNSSNVSRITIFWKILMHSDFVFSKKKWKIIFHSGTTW